MSDFTPVRGAPTGVFPYRSTSAILDDYLPSVVQPWLAVQRDASEMCRSRSAAITNCVRIPHIGWQLQAYQLDPGSAAWYSAAQSGNLTAAGGQLTLAQYHFEDDSFYQQDISGVDYAPFVQSSGTPWIVARPPAGNDWSTNVLTPDQTSFPSPNTAEDPTNMDRVALAGDGVTQPWDALTFQVYAPASAILPRASLANFYFNGPAGCDQNGLANPALVGTGQYSLKIRGDGRAYLYELAMNSTWLPRFSFMWNYERSAVFWTLITITIVSNMWQDVQGNYLGDKIVFIPSNQAQSPNQFSVIQNLAEIANLETRLMGKQIPVYNVPLVQAAPVTICPVRIDIARDCRASFRVARHVYQSTGTILDDFISMDQPLTPGAPIFLYWQGSLASDASGSGLSSWSAQVSDQAGTVLTPAGPPVTVTTKQGLTVYQGFTPTQLMTYAQVQFTLNASPTQLHTPTITNYALLREPTYQTVNPITPVQIPNRGKPPALWQQSIHSVDIHPQESDPGAENFTLVIDDTTGGLDQILEYGQMRPCLIQTTYESTLEKQAPLERGYILTARGQRMRNDGSKPWPSVLWTRWTCEGVGEWARATEAIVQRRFVWTNYLTGEPAKITDICRTLWGTIYPSSMIDVPDNPIELFTDQDDSYTSEPGQRIADTTFDLAQDYLGAYWVFDESAGQIGPVGVPTGMIRMLQQKTAPYNNLAIFEIEHPTTLAGDNMPRIPQWCAAYGVSTVGSQEVQHGFIQAGTLYPYRERAEGNQVVTYGGAVGDNASGADAQDAAMLSNFAIQVDSYNFLNLSPGSPGYPDGSSPEFFGRVVPIKCFDYKLGTQGAVDWKTRRIFDKACWSRYFLAFTGPMMLVTDATDPLQRTPRRLRFYDPVLIRNYDGTLSQFIVVSCMPSHVRDHVQMASYIVVTQGNINTIGIIDRQSSMFKTLLKGLGRINGVDPQYSGPSWASMKASAPVAARIMGLPQPTALPLQDLVNTSPTFGQFYAMTGFDALGGGHPLR